MFLLFLALSLFLLNFSLSKSYAKGFIQKCSLLRVKHYMLIGSSQCELGLWTGRHLFRGLMLSASFVVGDFLRLTCENLSSGAVYFLQRMYL